MTHGGYAVVRTAVVVPRGAQEAPRRGPDDVVVGAGGSESAQRAMTWATREARLRGGEVRMAPEGGPVGSSILRASTRASVLVLCTRPRGVLGTRFLAGVPNSVFTRAACPVVVVRGPDPDTPAQHWKPVVVGVDTQLQDPAVVAFAVREAQLRHVPLRVVAAWALPSAAGAGVAHFQADALAEWARSMAEEARAVAVDAEQRARATSPDLVVTWEVVEGAAAEALVARSGEAQLLVVGAGRHRRAGPVPRALLHRARCPVAVVPTAPGLVAAPLTA